MRPWIVGLCTLLLLPAAAGSAVMEEVRLVRSDAQGVEAEVVLPEPTVRESEGHPGHHTVTLGSLPVAGEPGEPALPRVGFWVALPPGATATVTAEGFDRLEWDAIRPLPVALPEWIEAGPGEIPAYRESIEEDSRVYAGGTFPASWAQIGPESSLRHLRVVPVTIFPARWDAGTGRLMVARIVRVTIRFVPGAARADGGRILRDDPGWERLYRSSVLNAETGKSWARRPVRPRRSPRGLPTSDLVKIEVRTTGLRKVTFADLQALSWAGAGSPLAELRLFERFHDPGDAADPPQTEVEVAVRIADTDASGTWTDGDALFFYAQNLYDRTPDAPAYLIRYGRLHCYWLGLRPGGSNARMESTSSWLGQTLTPVSSFPWTEHFEKEVDGYAKVGAGPTNRPIDQESNIQGGVASVRTKHAYWQGGDPYDPESGSNWYSVTFDLPGYLAPRGLVARFQGIRRPSDGLSSHRISLYLSGTSEQDTVRLPRTPLVATQQDSALYVASAADLAGYPLRESGNYFVHLESTSGYGAALHWFEVSYDRQPKFVSDRIQIATGSASGATEYRISRPPLDEIIGVEFTDPTRPRLLAIDPAVQIEGGGPSAVLRLQWQLDGSGRRFWVSGAGSVPRPEGLVPVTSVDLAAEGDEDYIVIIPRDWIPTIQPLIDRRESLEGGDHRVLVAAIEDLYDQFSGGRHWPHAIRSFLRTLFRTRDVPPAYLLLVGDATDAFDNNLVSSDPNWVPTQTIFSDSYTSYQGRELVSSDQWFVDNLTGTGEGLDFLPDMCVGRLPAGDTGQLASMVQKIVAYESFASGDRWRNRVLFVSDDFWSSTITFDARYQCNYFSEKIFRSAARSSRDVIETYGNLSDFAVDTFFVSSYMDTVLSLERCVVDPQTGRCMIDPETADIVCNPDPPEDGFLTNYRYGEANVAPLLWQMMSRGYLFVSFNGHANARLMTHEYIFRHSQGSPRLDVDRLTNSGRPFVFMGYGCHLAEFSASNERNYGKGDGISENLLLAANKAGIAAIASTGYEWLNTTDLYNLAVVEAHFKNPPQYEGHTRWVLGEVFARSKVNVVGISNTPTYQSMSATYTMLGDPGLIMDAAPPRMVVTLDGQPIESGTVLTLPADRDSILFEAQVRDEVWARSFSIRDVSGVVAPERYTVSADSADDRNLSASYKTTIYPQSYEIVLSAEDANAQVSGATYSVLLDTGFELRRPEGEWVELVEGDLVLDVDSVRVIVASPRLLEAGDIELLLDERPLSVRARAGGETDGDRAREWTLTALESIGKGSSVLAVRIRQPDDQTYTVTLLIETEESYEIESLYNVPNPFKEETWIHYRLGARADEVKIRIYTTSGKRIVGDLRDCRENRAPAGNPGDNWICWDGRDDDGDQVGNGLYFYKLTVRNGEGRVSKIEKIARAR